MILEQHYLACLSQASYLIVDEGTRAALVVDPRRDVDLYLDRAAELGARIEHVALTHFHADFLAGHLELHARTGARLWMGAAAKAEFDFEALRDGQGIELGSVQVVAMETPGHTPESVCLVVQERNQHGAQPKAVLTGDTLFVGDVGRPDLMASVGLTANELAGWLYDSLHEKLMTLPDETIVWPGHGAGSACGRSLSTDTSSTIGREKLENPALRPMTREAFVAELTENQPLAPAYFSRAAALNMRMRSTLEESLRKALVPLSLDELRAAAEAGAQVLDVRPRDEFAASHLEGSVWIGLDGRFASWAGTLLDLDRDVVLVAKQGEERDAALRLMRVGIDEVRGYLDASGAALQDSETRSSARVDVRGLSEKDLSKEGVLVLDVRTANEWREGHIADSRNIPLAELSRRSNELPGDGCIYVHCKTGYRSLVATSLMAGRLAAQWVDVEGGFDAWQAANLPVEESVSSRTPA